MGGTNSLTLSPFPLRFPPPLRMASRDVAGLVLWAVGTFKEGTNAVVRGIDVATINAATATVDLLDGAIFLRCIVLSLEVQ